MEKILISLPNELAQKVKTYIPQRKRSRVIRELLEKEIAKREKELYLIAKEVEQDRALNSEMSHWDITAGDGIEPEAW